jgi:hypothetical protein
MAGWLARALHGCVVAALGLSGLAARAGDGRLEINQACAVVTGCVTGDTPGFPVRLTRGSYVLTGNLEVSDPDASALFIAETHVWIDLGGFAIEGPHACPGPAPCGPEVGVGSGIEGFGAVYATVRNGSIRGFTNFGMLLREHVRVEDVALGGNGTGLECDDGSLVRSTRAVGNLGSGITTFKPVVTTGNAVVFADNHAERNGGHGIEAGEGSVIAGNLADGNGASGIEAVLGGQAIHDNRVRRNAGTGIRASAGTVVEGNTVTENGGLGLFLNPAAGFSFNTIRSDPAVGGSATLNPGAQNLGGNLCNGAATCP